MPGAELLSIGDLTARTGVARTALRYYEELGLLRPIARASGRRRYDPSAVRDVAAIRFLGEVGFSLTEIGAFLGADDGVRRQELISAKLADLDAQQRRLAAARAALEHGRRCPAEDPVRCPRFWAIIDGHLDGMSLEQSHRRAHRTPS